MKYFILLISILILVGCSPVIPEPPEPVTSIYIEPAYTDISLGKSVELFCYDQLDRPVMAHWIKRCGAGTFSVEIGESCVYTAPRTSTGVQEIYAGYEEMKATARVNGIKKESPGSCSIPKRNCTHGTRSVHGRIQYARNHAATTATKSKGIRKSKIKISPFFTSQEKFCAHNDR